MEASHSSLVVFHRQVWKTTDRGSICKKSCCGKPTFALVQQLVKPLALAQPPGRPSRLPTATPKLLAYFFAPEQLPSRALSLDSANGPASNAG